MAKILFLGGPAGVGKSTFASGYLVAQGWRHIEIDRRDGDGIELEGLRREWDAYYADYDPLPLWETLCRRTGDVTRLVVTFPGNCLFGGMHIGNARDLFHVFYLFGQPDFCLKAFLQRECHSGGQYSLAHWAHYNGQIFEYLSHPMNHWRLINAFVADGTRRPDSLILADIERLMKHGEAPGCD